MTLICMSIIERADNLTWPKYLSLFMAANAPSILQGCTWVVLGWIPAFYDLFKGYWWFIANVAASLIFYAFTATCFRVILLSRKQTSGNREDRVPRRGV